MSTVNEQSTLDKLLTISEVCSLLGVSRRWWYDRMQEGVTPAPVRIGTSKPRYSETQIREWIEEQTSRPQRTARPKRRRHG